VPIGRREVEMKVIWRQKGNEWEIAFGKGYRDEAQLQSFLAEYPGMIPFEDISDQIPEPKAMLREVGLPGSGSTGIVGVDELGGISILECKLAANPEVKRKVIGQVLEYAAFLWHKPYSFLDDVSISRLGRPLAQVVHDALDAEAQADWHEAAFVQSVTETLAGGRFRMIVAVDAINDDLRQTIEYLTEGPSKLELYALELTYFVSGEREIVIPHLHGAAPTVRSARPAGSPNRWNESRFFEDAERRNLPAEEILRMRELLRFCDEEATRTWWGVGRETGSFTHHVMKEGKAISIYTVFSDGRIQFNFGWLRLRVPDSTLAYYRDSLRAIPGLKSLSVREDFNHFPAVRVSKALATEEDLSAFERAVVGVRDQALATS
jgi:hypothetical protein